MAIDFSTWKRIDEEETEGEVVSTPSPNIDFDSWTRIEDDDLNVEDEGLRAEAQADLETRQQMHKELVGMEVERKASNRLKEREGVKTRSYYDSEEHLTGGIGHLLSEEEQQLYPEGTEIPQEVVDGWFKADLASAKKAAEEQAQELPEAPPKLIEALVSVNFQLGSNWNKEHKNTWKLLLEGEWKKAAEEAARSKWNEQTPKRVKDFQEALLEVEKGDG